MDIINRPGKGSIEYYPDGVAISSPRKLTPGNRNPPKRGKVKEWSSASRRRMRVFMLTHEPDGETIDIGATYTVPGPPLAVDEIRALWKWWSLRAFKLGWSAIWRMEVQKRGAVHWHAIVCVPRSFMENVHPDSLKFSLLMGCLPREAKRGATGRHIEDRELKNYAMNMVGKLWWKALDSLGPRTFDPPHRTKNGVKAWTVVDSLMQLPGAERRAACCEVDTGERGAYKRYLQDHASKSKQEQIAEGFGRHWGVVGRKGFRPLLPESVDTLTDAQFWRFIRAAQRMATPQLPSDAAPFGKQLGRRSKRGSWGRSIWYSRPATIARLVAWAASTS